MYILYPVTHPPKQNPGVVCVPLTPFALPSKQRVDGDRSQWSNVAHFPLPDRRGVGSVPRMGASAADHFREVNRRLGEKRRGQEGKTTRAPLDMANHRSAEGKEVGNTTDFGPSARRLGGGDSTQRYWGRTSRGYSVGALTPWSAGVGPPQPIQRPRCPSLEVGSFLSPGPHHRDTPPFTPSSFVLYAGIIPAFSSRPESF
ncbi:hypothetical protein VUR80DRAFT_1115 [Thermomyces stellatus]